MEEKKEIPDQTDKTVLIPAPTSIEDATRILPKEKQEAKMTIVAGENPNKEFLLKHQEMIIGRAQDCPILLDDKKVSRRHAKINFQDDSYIITDLGSFNGIFVNAKKTQQIKLKQNDIIEIGPFKLKFTLTGAAGPCPSAKELIPKILGYISEISSRLPQPFNKPRILIAAGALLILILLSLAVSLLSRPSSLSVDSGAAAKNSLLSQGLGLYKAKKYKEAADKFQAALEIEPENTQIQRNLNLSQEAYYFTNGLEDFNAGKWDAAIMKFTQVLAINPDQEKAKEYLETAKVRSQSAQHFLEGKQYADRGEWKQAVQEFNAALNIQPDYQQAQQGLSQAKDKLLSSEYFNQGKEKFEAERYIEAVAVFKKIPSQDNLFTAAQEYIEKANQIIEVNEYLKKATELYNNGNNQQAAAWLNKVPEKEKESRKINQLIEKIQAVAGYYNRANDLNSQGRTLEAYAELNKIAALETDPDNFFLKVANNQRERMRPQLSKNEEEAKELYRAGYVLRTVNPKQAVQNWKRVLELVPPDNEYYIKAKKMLENY